MKFIISLQKKKIRDEEKLFVIEGDKLVKEFLAEKIPFHTLAAKPEFINSLPDEAMELVKEVESVTYEELKLVSTLKTPHNALGIVKIPEREMKPVEIFCELSVALDCIQDPGNMGTIIRAAGWFGIKNIVCSENSVDIYNPKVIQASMGALLHVSVHYTSLGKFLSAALDSNIPVFGSVLDGEPVYEKNLGDKGIILLGNESKGISEELMPLITEKIMIPKFSKARHGIDSLNVGMAASVLFSEFRRKNMIP